MAKHLCELCQEAETVGNISSLAAGNISEREKGHEGGREEIRGKRSRLLVQLPEESRALQEVTDSTRWQQCNTKDGSCS